MRGDDTLVSDMKAKCRECDCNIYMKNLSKHFHNVHQIYRPNQQFTLIEWAEILSINNWQEYNKDKRLFSPKQLIHRFTLKKMNTKRLQELRSKLEARNFLDLIPGEIDIEFPEGTVISSEIIKDKNKYQHIRLSILPVDSNQQELISKFQPLAGDPVNGISNLSISYQRLSTIQPEIDKRKEKKKLTTAEKEKRNKQLIREIGLSLLKQNGYDWKCVDQADNWVILIEPKSKKRILAYFVTDKKAPKVLTINQIQDAIDGIVERFSTSGSIDTDTLREGTLTDCDWHAFNPPHSRRSALNLAMAVWGEKHIYGALKMCTKTNWAKNYHMHALKDDMKYVNQFINQRSPIKKKYHVAISLLVK